MASGTLSKVTASTAREVCQHFPLSDEAKPLLRDGLTPAQYLGALMEKQLHLDAIRLLAHALPKREAVWWACVCARSVLGNGPPEVTAALQAAEKWVADPSEENRRASQRAAEAAGMGNPAGCAAMACFWSSGSLAPPNVPAVPPAEHLTGHGVAGSVLLAAVASEPAKAPERYKQFLAWGQEVGDGVHRWKEIASKG